MTLYFYSKRVNNNTFRKHLLEKGSSIRKALERLDLLGKDAILFIVDTDQKLVGSLQYVDGVIGNSSSGLAEAPTFKVGTINIGDRQKGRLKAKSVIDCEPTKESIQNAVDTLYSKDFQKMLQSVVNPYGEGDSTEKIMDVLKNKPIPEETKKEFYDL